MEEALGEVRMTTGEDPTIGGVRIITEVRITGEDKVTIGVRIEGTGEDKGIEDRTFNLEARVIGEAGAQDIRTTKIDPT